MPEAVYMQNLMGIDGVIVDLVKEISEADSNMIKPLKADEGESLSEGVEAKPQFSPRELAFLWKLIPELIEL